MGIKHLSTALELQFKSASTKAVLIALANNANDEDGICWISSETMQRYTCLSERTVRSSLRDLEDLGILWIKRRKQATSIYHLNIIHPRPANFADLTVHQIVQDRQTSPSRPATVAPEPEYNQKDIEIARASNEQDARATLSAGLRKEMEEKYPGVCIDEQWASFNDANEAKGTVVANLDAAFRGWCRRIPSLKLAPKPRTKKEATEIEWSDPAKRRESALRTAALYRRMGRDEEADEIEREFKETGQ